MTDEELDLLVNLSIEHLQIDRETLDKRIQEWYDTSTDQYKDRIPFKNMRYVMLGYIKYEMLKALNDESLKDIPEDHYISIHPIFGLLGHAKNNREIDKFGKHYTLLKRPVNRRSYASLHHAKKTSKMDMQENWEYMVGIRFGSCWEILLDRDEFGQHETLVKPPVNKRSSAYVVNSFAKQNSPYNEGEPSRQWISVDVQKIINGDKLSVELYAGLLYIK